MAATSTVTPPTNVTPLHDGPAATPVSSRPHFDPLAPEATQPAGPAAKIEADAQALEAPRKPAMPGPSETRLHIEYDPDSGRFVQYGVDPLTGDVVRQIPTEEALRRITWLRETQEAKVDAKA